MLLQRLLSTQPRQRRETLGVDREVYKGAASDLGPLVNHPREMPQVPCLMQPPLERAAVLLGLGLGLRLRLEARVGVEAPVRG